MGIPIIGARSPHGRIAPGWLDIVSQKSNPNVKNEVDTYTIKVPAKYRRFILLGIGVGSAGQSSSYKNGAGGGGAAKGGFILPFNDTLTIVVPRVSADASNDLSWNNFQAPPLVVSSAGLGVLMTVSAGFNGTPSSTSIGSNPGQGIVNRNDFNVQNAGSFSGGLGGAYTGDYGGIRAGAGIAYAGGGGGGAHGNLGGFHGGYQTSAAFVASLAQARQKLGATIYALTQQGGASHSPPTDGTVEPKDDVSFGGGSGGTIGGTTYYPGRAFFRLAWGLTTDGGNINPLNTGW